MRIGIDARLWNESGVGRYIRNLLKYLSKLDVSNEYVLFLQRPQFKNLKFQISNLKSKKILADIRWHTLREQFLFPKILEQENLDLVHFPYFSVPIFYKGPFVITIHDLTLSHFLTGRASTLPYPAYFLKHLGYQFVLKRVIKKAKKVIVPSQATKEEIVDHFKVPKEKIAVTYEGVNFSKIDKRPPFKNAKFNLKKSNYFLYVGNAYPHKNLERLMEAFLNLKMKNEKYKTTIKNLKLADLKLLIVGKEDYFSRRLKDNVREMGLLGSVIFYGQANDQELVWFYKHAIALVLPSLMEGFGLPALEAMSCGCLVLASDIPALKEVCKEAAIYFNPYKVKEMAEVMKQAFCYSNTCLAGKGGYYSNLCQKGLERAKMFSWQKMARETLKIYQEVGKAA